MKPSTVRNWGSDFQFYKKARIVYPHPEQISEEVTLEELLNHFKQRSEIFRKVINYRSEIDVTIETDVPIALTFWADHHVGSEGVDYNKLEKDTSIIKEVQGLFVYMGGDGIDNFLSSSINPVNSQEAIALQRILRKKIIEEVRDKIVCVGTGNHEWWTNAAAGFDDWAEIVRDLNILYTGLGGLLKLKVGDITYKIFRSHKVSGATNGNNLLGCVKNLWKSGPIDFDIGAVEHGHVAGVEPFRAHKEEKVAIRTGTYKVYDEYALGKGFYGISTENPTVVLYPNIKKMVPFLHMEDAIDYMQGIISG